MTHAQRTRDMTDAEVLEDLKAHRHTPPPPGPERHYLGVTSRQWGEAALWTFAIIGFATTLNVIGQLLVH